MLGGRCGGRSGSEWSGARIGMGGDGVCAGVGAGVVDATLPSPSRELSLSRIMPSAEVAMVDDGRGRVHAYRPAERERELRGCAGALWPENEEI